MKKIILLILFTLIFAGCTFGKDYSKVELKGKKVLMVVAPKDFRDEELSEPKQILEEAGAEVKVASIQSGEAVGVNGLKVKINETVSSVNVGYYEAVVFTGGPGMALIVGDDTLQKLASDFFHSGKIVTAICAGPAVLARAGVLTGKKATGWEKTRGDIEKNGATYTGEPVTIDGRVITASGPEYSIEFGQALKEMLAKE